MVIDTAILRAEPHHQAMPYRSDLLVHHLQHFPGRVDLDVDLVILFPAPLRPFREIVIAQEFFRRAPDLDFHVVGVYVLQFPGLVDKVITGPCGVVGILFLVGRGMGIVHPYRFALLQKGQRGVPA